MNFSNSSFNLSLNDQVRVVVKEVQETVESEILKQLNELVSRNLLVWEQSQMVLVSDPFSKLSIQYVGKLVLKDQEYIEKLETELKGYKAELKEYRDIFDKLKNLKEID